MKTNQKNNSGFTLVELAIVIVIIGLLVGGVLQGQELIKQAQIRSAMSAVQGYNAAINTFRAKYNEMPGDISRADTFGLNAPRGGAVNVCATSAGTAATTTAGGVGNGNGILEATGTTACASTGAVTAALATITLSTAAWSGEVANFWVHLGNAQLVKGAYSQATANTNVNTAYPAMSVGTGIVALTSNGLTHWVLGVPATIPTMAAITGTGTLSPSEAFGIDGKLDDGAPNTGAVQATGALATAAYTGSFVGITTNAAACSSAAGAYNIATTYGDTKLCTITVRADG
jgi:prepilin-type N-terminal cleavage/methylation domain-containing protein